MKLAFATVAASLVAGTAALAGGYTEPVETPVIAPVEPIVTAQPSDWSGFYAGLQYGQGSTDFSGAVDDDDFDAYGLHAGYNHDFGRFVLGGELDYNKLDFDNSDDDGDLTRLRARAGYDLGRFLPYVTLGAAKVSYETAGLDVSETGMTYGLGADFKVTDRFVVGAEYSRQEWDDAGDVDGLDLDADLIQLRASYHF